MPTSTREGRRRGLTKQRLEVATIELHMLETAVSGELGRRLASKTADDAARILRNEHLWVRVLAEIQGKLD